MDLIYILNHDVEDILSIGPAHNFVFLQEI